MKLMKNSRGIAIIYVTLFLMVLGLLFVALGVDVGWLAFVRSQGQAAVDAGALRGAAAIPNYNSTADPTNVYSMVAGLNSSNTVMNQSAGLTGTNVEFCTGDPNNPTCPSATIPAGGIRVTKPYTAPLYFGKLFKNGSTADLTVSAIAWLGGPASYRGDLPIALCAEQINYRPDESGTFMCVDGLDTTLTPNIADNAGWWTPLGITANANDCRRLVNGTTEIETTSVDEEINLNNGELTACLKAVEDRFAAVPCFERATEVINADGTTTWIRGTDGEQCDAGYSDTERTERCTVVLPVVECPNSINQQQPIVGYASVCIRYVQANPASVATVLGTLQCNVTVDAPGGGPVLGTYASRPVLVK